MNDYDGDILDIIRGASGSNAEMLLKDDSEVTDEMMLKDDDDGLNTDANTGHNTDANTGRNTDTDANTGLNTGLNHKHPMSINVTPNTKASSKRNTKSSTHSITAHNPIAAHNPTTAHKHNTDHNPTTDLDDSTHSAPLSHSLRKKASKRPTFAIQDAINKVLYQTVPISAFIQDVIDARVKNTVGIYCKKCGSDNVFSESRQTRAADEATTIFYTCLNCGNKWKMN